MNPIYLIPLAIVIILVVVDQVARRRSVAKAAEMFGKGEFEELLDYLETTYVRMFYPRYNRMYMQFKTLDAKGETEAASEVLDLLYAAKPSDEQRSDLLVVSFEFYLRNHMNEQALKTLERTKATPALEPAAAELETLYDVLANKGTGHIDEMEKQLDTADAATRQRLLYLLSKQYENLGNAQEAERYRKLMEA